VRRRVIVGRRRHTADPEDHDTAELVHAADCRAGIVDCGRHGAQRYVNNLDDAELDILLQGASLLDTAFEQIRHYATADVAVSLRLMRASSDIVSATQHGGSSPATSRARAARL
jgi:hypothetical protein